MPTLCSFKCIGHTHRSLYEELVSCVDRAVSSEEGKNGVCRMERDTGKGAVDRARGSTRTNACWQMNY